jgi:hypothetical protein
MLDKLKALGIDGNADDAKTMEAIAELEKTCSPEELKIMDTIRARRMVRAEDSLNIENYSIDVIDGMAPHLERGNLTLKKAKKAPVNFTKDDVLSRLGGESKQKMQKAEELKVNVEVKETEVAATA